MSGDDPVTRYEFETYKSLARELREADRGETQRVSHEVQLVEQTVLAKIEGLDAATEARFEAVAAQRETDRQNALQAKEHKWEWSWSMKVTVVSIAVALAGVYVELLAVHH